MVIKKANIKVFHGIKNAMESEVQKAGIYTEDDVVKFVKCIKRNLK